MLEVLTACWIRFSLFAVCFSFNVLPCFFPLAFRGDLLAMTTPSLVASRIAPSVDVSVVSAAARRYVCVAWFRMWWLRPVGHPRWSGR